MKRILFISPRLEQGGAERQSVTIAILLKKKGYDVEFLCYSYGDFFEKYLNKENIPVYWLQHNYFMRLLVCTWFIHRGRYDVVISFLPTPSFINGFSSIFFKRWKVITGERSSVVCKPHSLLQRISAWLRRNSDYIICNSNNARILWEKQFPMYKTKLKTIYNAVTLSPVNSKYTPLASGKLHICIAATVSDVKNPIGLINALIEMTNSERDKIIIDWYGKKDAQIGDTTVYEEVRYLLECHKLKETIRLFDATNDISEKMMKSDFVALFSKHEGLPNAICEGMMLGKPIIMTRVSDYNTLVEGNGLLCDWDCIESIKSVLLKAASLSSDDILRMGSLSRQKAILLFSEDKILKDWIGIID